MIKNVRNLSITGVCALILCYILEAAGVSEQNSFFEKLYLYCETLVPGNDYYDCFLFNRFD